MHRAFIIHQTFFYNHTLPLIGRNFTRVVNAQQKLFSPYTNTLSIDTSLRSLNIKMYAVSKLNKQHEQTWINLQKRLNSVQFPYEKLFTSQDVHRFVKNKAVSVGSCEGYFIPSLLTTTAFLMACNKVRVDTSTHKQPLNLLTVFVGYPGTGK